MSITKNFRKSFIIIITSIIPVIICSIIIFHFVVQFNQFTFPFILGILISINIP
uniref:Uncharacterized protein n=1 Tax=Meloidogyne enterolobii TaxID=390850 RepID=A0A6V7TTB4_MELEN|nr:unnamed protein product [Meloidogyne enterolobii]